MAIDAKTVIKRSGLNGLKYRKTVDKKQLLDNIVVTISSGKTFNGNETARNNMMSAIMAAEIVGKAEEEWKLADNTTVVVNLAEIKEALALSIQEVGVIVKTYN